MAEPAGSEALTAAIRRLVERDLLARVAGVEWLDAGLGLRRFARVRLEAGSSAASAVPATLVARVEAPEDPAGRPAGSAPEPALEPIRAALEAQGLPVPLRHGGDAKAGIELLEDVGDVSLQETARQATPAELRGLYEEACDLVPRLQGVSDPGGLEAFRRRLDAPLFAYKAELFIEHAVPLRLRGGGASPGESRVVRDAFAFVAAEALRAPARLAHRDFQSANLHLRPGPPSGGPPGVPPGGRLVLLDLQGAFLAPPEYDLVCLLRDSYVELDAAELLHQLGRIRPRLPDAPSPESFARRFDLLTLTRKGKDLARFAQVARQRGDERFLRFVPATVRALHAAAERAAQRDPQLAGLAELVAALPEEPCAG